MTQQDPQEYAAELDRLQSDLKTYRRNYNEYSNDKSIPLKEKAPILANFARLISSTLDRIKILEERLSEFEPPKAEQPKQVAKSTAKDKEKQLEKKSVEAKAIPEKAPPPETKETKVPVTTSKRVADKIILVIEVDPTKSLIRYLQVAD
jgi:hypothetical protein